MSTKFAGSTRGLIRGLANRIRQVQAADTREAAQADKVGRIPLLFASTKVIKDAMTKLLARCNEALTAS